MNSSYSVSLSRPELLQIEYEGRPFYGCDQSWYPTNWQRKAGCGPTVAACALTYLNQARPLTPALPYSSSDQTALLEAMQDVWRFIQPAMMGLNSTAKYRRGISDLLQHYRLNLYPQVLDVPRAKKERPDVRQTSDFIAAGLKADSPVAFLNLHSGSARDEGLDHWHWVSVIALEEAKEANRETTFRVHFLDEGRQFSFNLAAWLRTTTLGGGFVYLAE